MRSIVLSWMAVFALASCQPAGEVTEQDTPGQERPGEIPGMAEADPEHVTVELENDYVRVFRERYQAGDLSPLHSHADGVAVLISGGKVTLTPQGAEPQAISVEPGEVVWSAATAHSAVLETDFEAVFVELEPLEGEEVVPSEVDATRVDSEHHELVFENDRVRVLRMTYPAGSKSPVHDHLPGVNVTLTAFHTRNVPESGEPEEAEGDAGVVLWSEGTPPHATENLGEADVVVIRVEMKRNPSRSPTD